MFQYLYLLELNCLKLFTVRILDENNACFVAVEICSMRRELDYSLSKHGS